MRKSLKPFEVKKFQVATKNGDKQLPLMVAEFSKLFSDFKEASRIYWIVNNKSHDVYRGGHYHPKKSEILFVIVGSVTFTLESSIGKEEISLNEDDNKCMIIRPNVYHELLTSPGSIILVACPGHFESDEAQDDNMYLEYQWD